ncbi:MAG: carbamoyltransferase [Bacteroidales bacterium]|nr:carbamoyltransferase [Bacteroidales bacterium]
MVVDGDIVAAAQEERFTRKKHDASFPVNAIRYCLLETVTSIDDLDAVVFYDKPMLKFERLLETYYGFAPRGLLSFVTSIPVWIKEKVFLKKLIYDKLRDIENYNRHKLTLLFTEHHLSHAASAFFPSGFRRAAILTVDGVGEWATASVSVGEGNTIKILKELRFPHSLGLLYSAFTYFLGFRVNSGEYKLMGLAPYGIPESERVKRFISLIRENLVDYKNDGSVWLNQQYFSYSTGLRMVSDRKWSRLFGFNRRLPEDTIEQHHCDLAYAIQQVTEEIMLAMASHAKELTGADSLCLAGGVALNCVANGKLLREKLFSEIYIQPAAGDAGGAVGAALSGYYIYFKKPANQTPVEMMKGSFLGPSFSNKEVEHTLRKYNAAYAHFSDYNALTEKTAVLIAEGKVVGWFQGRMEFGPRALGNRSILGDARNRDMQKKLNLKIKYRESFRPFAPAVLMEDNNLYFNLDTPSPYMLLVASVKEDKRKSLPSDYYHLPLMDRLYVERSEIPAITHIDLSARIQTVHKETNERFWTLLNAFKRLTGCSLMVNTSYNVRGEPIVCTPEDAYRCFMRTEMDCLVINDYLLDKTLQPEWKDQKNWRDEFTLD